MAEGIDTREDAVKPSDKPGFVREWLEAIELAGDEEKDWRKDGEEAIKIFRAGDREGGKSFNILHANTETLLPALYNSVPVPDVRRRWNDGRALANPTNPEEKQQAEASSKLAKDVADTIERSLSYTVDQYDFDGLMQAVVRDMSLPGRGVSRIRLREEPNEQGTDVGYQMVTCEHVPWAMFRHGPGRTWPDVPWVAFCHYLSRKQLKKLAPAVGGKVQLDADTRRKGSDPKPDGPVPDLYGRATVWEIWDKEDRKVIFVATGWDEGPLKTVDDPLSLDGFFPCPQPMQALRSPDTLTPITPYEVYRDQAEELNLITRRIAKIISTLKVKGGYAAVGNLAADLKSMEDAEDGELIPFSGVEQFLQQGGLEKAVLFWPLEPAVKALAQLYEQREQIKQTIYEITGIADILRGQSDPNETLGAQQIKQQWGSLRIQRQQAEVARFARDLFRMKAELIATRFTPQNLEVMTGIRLAPEAQQILKSDALRSYRIDIESDSTIRADMTRSQEQMNLFLQGTAQFAQSLGGVIPIAPQLLPAAVEVYTAFARKFKLGKQAEDALDSLSQQAPQMAEQAQGQQGDPAAQAKAQADQAKVEIEAKRLQLDEQDKARTHDREDAKAQAEFQFKDRELGMKEQELQLRDKEIETNAQLKVREQDTHAQLEDKKLGTSERVENKKLRLGAATKKKELDAVERDAPEEPSKPDPLSELAKQLMDQKTKPDVIAELTRQIAIMVAQNSRPRRAKKNPDGSFSMTFDS